MADTKRLFFALWPNDATRSAILETRRSLPAFDGRVVHPADFHITLCFLGNVPSERRACVVEAAGGLGARAFTLTLDHTGLWSRSRILWCAPSVAPGSLCALVDGLWDSLSVCGFKPENRPYRPHVTLARKASLIPTGPLERPFSWRCNGFVLVASEPGGEPPVYRVLREWHLREEKISTDS
jgi:2'-5' RNA ligase